MKDNIVIIGSGQAGTALHMGLSHAGYEVRFAKKGRITETAALSVQEIVRKNAATFTASAKDA